MVNPATPTAATTSPQRTTPLRILASSEDLAATVGLWSSLAAAVALALAMVIFAVIGPWRGMARYAADANGAAAISVWVLFLLLTIFFVPVVAAVHAATPERLRLLSLTGLGFAVMYAAICSANCLIQVAFVRQRIAAGDLTGLEAWTSASPNSALFGTDNLAFFLQGLSTLVLAPLFGGSLLMMAIRWLFVFNGIFNTVGLVMISATSMAAPGWQKLYAAVVLIWGNVLAVALALLAVAFRRRLLPGFTAGNAP